MTTKPVAPPEAPANREFPSFPPRDDMQNSIHLHEPAHQSALRRHLGNSGSTIVLSELPLAWHARQQRDYLIPDLLVAFNVNRADILMDKGYAIDEWGKPPDFVLEIASPWTARNDYVSKRKRYAEYGVPEYWRFDGTGENKYPQPLAGDRLVNGEYRPIEIRQAFRYRHWGRSRALNLDLCWEYGYLRWHNPATGLYLLTHDQEAEARLAAEAQRDAERNARLAAEAQRDAERNARLAAEAEAMRLREQLHRLPGE